MKRHSYTLVFYCGTTGQELEGEPVYGIVTMSEARKYAIQRLAQVGNLYGKEVEVEIRETYFDPYDLEH
jgi:hypothetical protein